LAGTIAVSGGLAQRPGRGGHAWVFVTWLLALRELGWSVVFVDRLEEAWIDHPVPGSVEAGWLAEVMRRFDLERDWALLYEQGDRSLGLTREELRERLDDSATLINVMGYLDDPELRDRPRHRIYLDIDPGWPQMWTKLGLYEGLAQHDDYVTVGRNLGAAGCKVPECGIDWNPIWPPVLLDQWEPTAEVEDFSFTSVATWRGPNSSLEYEGGRYGLRAHSFRQLAVLPESTGETFLLALDLGPEDEEDLRLLLDHGWDLEDPLKVAGDPDSYRDFIRGSGAELSVAKELYALTGSGWFSDRSSAYLAAGKPVLALDTGVPPGPDGGLLVYSSLAEAEQGVAEIGRDRPGHAAAARAFAEEHLDARRVVGSLLERLEVG
jgi:hypothetical protein